MRRSSLQPADQFDIFCDFASRCTDSWPYISSLRRGESLSLLLQELRSQCSHICYNIEGSSAGYKRRCCDRED